MDLSDFSIETITCCENFTDVMRFFAGNDSYLIYIGTRLRYLAIMYLFEVNIRNTRKRCVILLKNNN